MCQSNGKADHDRAGIRYVVCDREESLLHCFWEKTFMYHRHPQSNYSARDRDINLSQITCVTQKISTQISPFFRIQDPG